MNIYKYCAFLGLIFFALNSFSKTYYVSEKGLDTNTGLTESSPFNSVSRINQIQILPGDSILFHGGHQFTGELQIKSSGTPGKPIYFGAYGKKESPVITGAVHLSNWNEIETDIYLLKSKNEIKQLYIGNIFIEKARIPDSGYFRIDKNDSIYLFDDHLLTINSDISDATLRVLTCNWQWENRVVTNKISNYLLLDSMVWRPFRKGFSYYLENKREFINEYNEWCFLKESNELIIKAEKNFIKNKVIEGAIYANGVSIADSMQFIHIEGIEFSKHFEAGINVGDYVENIIINGCEFHANGIYGIKFERAANACRIYDNSVLNCTGIGVSMLEPQNCIVENNRFKRIGLMPGYGFDGVNNGTGIAIINREFRADHDTIVATDNKILYNRIDSTGYNGIRVDGRRNLVAYNIVNHAVLTMNDGAGIYCWALPDNHSYTSGNVIYKNIVANVLGNTVASAGEHNITACIYIDNFSNNIQVKENVIYNCKKGILLNDASYSIEVRGNIIYNTLSGLVIDIYLKQKKIRRGKFNVVDNTFYLTSAGQNAVVINEKRKHDFELGTIDSNLYVSPVYPALNRFYRKTEGVEIYKEYEISAWQDQLGYDLNSKAYYPGKGDRWWEIKDRSHLKINNLSDSVTVKLAKGKYIDISGKKIEEIEIEPFSAIIVRETE